MNALRHGLTARVVVLPSEDMAAYQAFSKEIVDSLDAQTPVERQFAQTVADNQWCCSSAMNRSGLIPGMCGREKHLWSAYKVHRGRHARHGTF